MKVKKILVSQPEPSSEKSPYNRLKEKLNLVVDFRPFIHVEGVIAKEVRKQKEPSQEQQYALRKAKECWTLWNSDSQDWIKQGMTIPIPSQPNQTEENQAGN